MAFVQSNVGSIADAGTLAYSSNVGSGVALFAVLSFTGVTAEGLGITDTLGNTWTLVRRFATASKGIEIWKAHCPTGGANTLTFDYDEAITAQIIISEFDGFTNGVSTDQQADGANDTTSPQLAGSITTTQAIGVALAMLRFTSNFSVTSWSAGFTAISGVTNRTQAAYLVTGTTDTLAPAATCAANEDTIGIVANFYETPGGGGSVVPILMRQFRVGRA